MAKRIIAVNAGPRKGMFDPEEEQKHHDCVFPEEMKKAYEMGNAMG